MKRSLLALVLFLVPALADAKCVIPQYEIEGWVYDSSGKVISGAVLGVSWVERGVPKGPILASSDGDGHFHLKFQFNTFSRRGLFVGDVCKGNLREVSVAVSSPAGAYESWPVGILGAKTSVKLSVGVRPKYVEAVSN